MDIKLVAKLLVVKTQAKWKHDYPYCPLWEALLDYYEDTCLHCGRRGGVTVDHVIPVAVGGENRIANLQPLCEECNCEKDMDTTDYRDPYLHAMFLSALCEEGIL